MSKYIINGGKKLSGALHMHGAKNSVLPILAATILSHGVSEIHNCPRLSDVDAAINILKFLGCKVVRDKDVVVVDATHIIRSDVPDSLMQEMRSSIVFLGAIVARTGEATMTFPGGCELGTRPIDLHLAGLSQLGVKIDNEGGQLNCRVEKAIVGSKIALSFPSVGATENIILAAATAKGTTTILNAAREPEIIDLCDYLIACGAKIKGAGEGEIIIQGVSRLEGTVHRVIPDRIATVTYMAAVAATGGYLVMSGVLPQQIETILPVFEEAGCRLSIGKNELFINSPQKLNSINSIRTMPYPGFPTDAQSPIMAMACVAEGTSVFVETIFESRFKHVGELHRMGAKIKTEGRVAIVTGVDDLSGASVHCTDLRGGAALVIAGLAAKGVTKVGNLWHIDRGYEDFEENLRSIGADITRS